MLSNWLKPATDHNTGTGGFFNNIPAYHDNPEALQRAKLAFIGVRQNQADAIRRELDKLAPAQAPMIDLGNLIQAKPNFAVQLFGLLLQNRIVPILFGAAENFISALYHAYQLNEKMVSLTIADRRIRFNAKTSDDTAYLNKLLNPLHPNLFHLSIIGTQSHLNSPHLFDILHENDFDILPLAGIRHDISEAEPIIRDADLFVLNTDVLHYADYPAQTEPYPLGISAHQACTLARYAGMSDKLSAFGLFGSDPAADTTTVAPRTAALIIHYFIHGFISRQKDFPASKSNLKKYVVMHNNHQLAFWKSRKTGRWWIEIPVIKPGRPPRHALMPCSHKDYLAATKGNLPDRLIKGLIRFS